MDWTLLSWAFLAGAAATVNPCGLAMLPAYVSYYVGRNEGDTHPGRGFAAGLLLSLGTLSVFTLMGLVITSLGTAVARFVPWLALLVAVPVLAVAVLLVGLNIGPGRVAAPGGRAAVSRRNDPAGPSSCSSPITGIPSRAAARLAALSSSIAVIRAAGFRSAR